MRIGSGLTLLLGGARSGKSDLAVSLASTWPAPVVFVATATAGDGDMAERIRRHQEDRPSTWDLVELADFDATQAALLDANALVIVDCITLLVANLLFAEEPAHGDDAIVDHVGALGASLALRAAPTLVVTNEVGLGIHPDTPLGRRYRDLLGRTNRAMADHAETTLFVAAGRAVRLEEIEPSW